MNEQKVEKKVVGRTVAIALGIICIILVVGLVGAIASYTSIISDKDNTISSQGSQISNLNNTIRSQNNTIATQNVTIIRLEKFENLTDQILSPIPYGYDGEWVGQWSQIAIFNENSVSGGKTSDFQIESPYHLWRFNFTIQGNLRFNIVQDVGSQQIVSKEYQVTNGAQGTSYMLEYSVSSPVSYHFEFPTGSFAGNWTITIEELHAISG